MCGHLGSRGLESTIFSAVIRKPLFLYSALRLPSAPFAGGEPRFRQRRGLRNGQLLPLGMLMPDPSLRNWMFPSSGGWYRAQ